MAGFGICVVSSVLFWIPISILMMEGIQNSLSNNLLAEILILAVFGLIWAVSSMLGGFIAGRMGKENPTLNGIWVGGILGGIALAAALLNTISALASGDLLRTALSAVLGLDTAAVVFFLTMLGGKLAGRSGGKTA